ncbi:hypothetical protein Lal_00028668 [Lupinus albus]|nr:hypothetical protein Lal_00028668 [Lupinus albus]
MECEGAINESDEGTWKRRKLAVFEDGGVITFNEEDLKNIRGYERGSDYIEVVCGCTNKKYGDFIGKLRINDKVNVTLVEFEKHAGIQGNGKWKSNIWVHTEEEDRVPLWRTPLFKYYTHLANVPNWIDAANRKRTCHRDEFILCSSCKKERRFRLRTRQQIGEYHAALNNKMWKCSDWPYQKITCDDAQERLGLRTSRGCTRASGCQGCTTCYCGGCIMCRFENCTCHECRDFMLFAEP